MVACTRRKPKPSCASRRSSRVRAQRNDDVAGPPQTCASRSGRELLRGASRSAAVESRRVNSFYCGARGGGRMKWGIAGRLWLLVALLLTALAVTGGYGA